MILFAHGRRKVNKVRVSYLKMPMASFDGCRKHSFVYLAYWIPHPGTARGYSDSYLDFIEGGENCILLIV